MASENKEMLKFAKAIASATLDAIATLQTKSYRKETKGDIISKKELFIKGEIDYTLDRRPEFDIRIKIGQLDKFGDILPKSKGDNWEWLEIAFDAYDYPRNRYMCSPPAYFCGVRLQYEIGNKDSFKLERIPQDIAKLRKEIIRQNKIVEAIADDLQAYADRIQRE